MIAASDITSLSTNEIESALKNLPGWQMLNGKLHKEFKFKDFSEAFGFMTRVAIEAEVMNHHPDWYNSYKVVTIDLINHEKGSITNLDVELATKIENLLK